jgi:hypothetical protein
MGKGEESSAETEANHISSRKTANRGGAKGEVGEDTGCEEKIGGAGTTGSEEGLVVMMFSTSSRLSQSEPECV